MPSFSQNYFVRNIDAGDFLESFLISAIFSLIGIRVYLKLTNFPQIGGSGLHVAHMLWGGLLMLVALIILFSFINKSAIKTSTIVGGIGFGAFIDELGKFITRDNNYFFQPTIALVYVIFIILFFIFRYFDKRKKLTKHEYLMNSLFLTAEVINGDLDKKEKTRLLGILRQCDQNSPMTIALKKVVLEIDFEQNINFGPFALAKLALRNLYFRIIRSKWASRIIIVFFICYTLFGLYIIWSQSIVIFGDFTHTLIITKTTFSDFGELFSSTISALFIVIGTVTFYTSRLVALQMYRRAMLISIFLTQFFVFYEEQLSALAGLVVNIIILSVLQYMINQEKVKRELEEKN